MYDTLLQISIKSELLFVKLANGRYSKHARRMFICIR